MHFLLCVITYILTYFRLLFNFFIILFCKSTRLVLVIQMVFSTFLIYIIKKSTKFYFLIDFLFICFISSNRYDIGAPGGIRTPDLPVRSRTLYPTKLLVHTQYYNYFSKFFQDIFYNLYIFSKFFSFFYYLYDIFQNILYKYSNYEII